MGMSPPMSDFIAIFWHCDVSGQGTLSKLPQVDVDDAMLRNLKRLSNPPRRIQLDAMPLAVVEGERIERRKAIRAGDGQAGGAVQAAGGEDDGGAGGVVDV